MSLLSGKRGFLHFLLFVQRYRYLKDDSIINDEISEPVMKTVVSFSSSLFDGVCERLNKWRVA